VSFDTINTNKTAECSFAQLMRAATMENTEVTLLRSAKIWWSFVWRSACLSAIIPPVQLLLSYVLVAKPGPAPDQSGPPAGLVPLLLIGFLAMVFAQTVAIRWMLRKAQWSDFKISLVRTNTGT
jgi:hypothetical protein